MEIYLSSILYPLFLISDRNTMLLGLDIGTKRTGAAISEGEFAHEYATLDSKNLVAEVRGICQKEGVKTIIIGLPLNGAGQSSVQTDFVRQLGEEVEQVSNLPVVYENERLTTIEAERILKQMGASQQDIEQRIDQFSAQLILQQYLDEKKAV